MNTITDINIGDLVYRSKGIVQHVGVFLGNDTVIHNSPDRDIQEVSFKKFSEGKEVKFKKIELDNISTLIERLEEMRYSTSKYSPTSHNCEQFATKLLGMRPTSPQVNGTITGAILGGLFGYLTGKNILSSMAVGGVTGLTVVNSTKKYDGIIKPDD